MEYESSYETASRLQVHVRTIQKWAKEGRIPGAKRIGKSWMIPRDIKGPDEEILVHQVIMPFLNTSFEPGTSQKEIADITSETERAIAQGEYAYFSGQPAKAVSAVEPYLHHDNVGIALSACVIYILSAFSMGEFGQKLHGIEEKVEAARNHLDALSSTPELGDYAVTAAMFQNAIIVMMQLPLEIKGELKFQMKYLPEGLKLFGAYIIAHHLYLQHEFQRALGTVQMAQLMISESYLVARIYLKLMEAICLMELRQIDNAKTSFMEAWTMAKPDNLIEPFADHFGLLHGLTETCLKRSDPVGLHQILQAVRRFNKGWKFYHEKVSRQLLTDYLTPTEFSVAMMYHKSWTIKEIAAGMEISERMVKHHIAMIYEKLGVSSRVELNRYLQE